MTSIFGGWGDPAGPFGLSKAARSVKWLLPWPNTNADTLTAHNLNELQAHVKLEHPNIICNITEVEPENSCDKICDEAFNINGYNMIRLPPNRGIIIYTAHHLMASKLDISSKFDSSLWIYIKISKDHNIIVGTINRSPNSSDENNLLLLSLQKEVSKMKHDHIILKRLIRIPDRWRAV